MNHCHHDVNFVQVKALHTGVKSHTTTRHTFQFTSLDAVNYFRLHIGHWRQCIAQFKKKLSLGEMCSQIFSYDIVHIEHYEW